MWGRLATCGRLPIGLPGNSTRLRSVFDPRVWLRAGLPAPLLCKLPTFPEGRLDEPIRLRVVRDLHLRAVPLQLAFEAQRQNAEHDPFRERPRDAEIGACRFAALRRTDPVVVV